MRTKNNLYSTENYYADGSSMTAGLSSVPISAFGSAAPLLYSGIGGRGADVGKKSLVKCNPISLKSSNVALVAQKVVRDEIASFISLRLRVNNLAPTTLLDPDVNNIELINPKAEYLTISIVRGGEMTLKKKNQELVQERSGKRAIYQKMTPDFNQDFTASVAVGMSTFGLGMGAAVAMSSATVAQVEDEPKQEKIIETDYCLLISPSIEASEIDYTKKKWTILDLSDFEVGEAVNWVKNARKLATNSGIFFFKMVVFSNLPNASEINEAFGGTGAIVRHYTEDSFENSLTSFEEEIKKAKKFVQDRKKKQRT